MAGIIGTMTAQARLRRGRKEILSDKCVYILKPFSSNGFDPNIHNKFVMARNSLKMMEESLNKNMILEDYDIEMDVRGKEIIKRIYNLITLWLF